MDESVTTHGRKGTGKGTGNMERNQSSICLSNWFARARQWMGGFAAEIGGGW